MGRLIDALNESQHERGYLSKEQLRHLAVQLEVPLYRLQELVSFYPHFRSEPPKRVQLSVCRDVVCHMAGGKGHVEAMRHLAAKHDGVEVCEVSCLGRCETAPAIAVGDVPMSAASVDGVSEALTTPPKLDALQHTPRSWQCDPYAGTDDHYGILRDFIQRGCDGGAAIATIKDSGLRGMGGAGFPTGVKWGFVENQASDEKYVVCNADESEPGTFKDRVILSDLPHLVIEGMVLAGLSVGAEKGIVFIRHEYLPERNLLAAAVARARSLGVLGDDVLGSGRPFELSITVSPGGYILGEETALLECLEDKRGEPRNKPPFPGEHGLWGKPTLINNVETLAFVPLIMKEGADAWRGRGQGPYAGLKFIALSGDVEKPDVYEVPMGTTIAALIDGAGGMKDGQALYALAPGGASSNFITADGADLALDFEALKEAGTMLGSGAVLAVAEGRDVLELATNIVAFFRNESCGKCVPCRIGSEKAVLLLEDALEGRAKSTHLPLIDELHDTMAQTSICGLGQVALSPFISVKNSFAEDVEPRFGEE